MVRYLIISTLILTLSGCSNRQSKPDGNVNRPPNILIVTADDLAYNSVSAFGCRVPGITPNIDKLAEQGIRFTNAHVNTAVCQPCRQSWLTGRFPHNNGAEGFEPIDEDVPTLPEQLKKAGVTIVDEIETFEYGKFVHLMDMEGNKIELWEPDDIEYDKLVEGRTK